MARNKSIFLEQFPNVKFTNRLDAGLYTWLRKFRFKFDRNVKVDLINTFDYNLEKVKAVGMVLHYLIKCEDKIAAVVLLRTKQYGIHPNQFKIPLLKHNFKEKGGFPLVFEVFDDKTANDAVTYLYQNLRTQQKSTPVV